MNITKDGNSNGNMLIIHIQEMVMTIHTLKKPEDSYDAVPMYWAWA